MKTILCIFQFSAIILLIACLSSPEKKYSEGISNNTLTVYLKIDLYLIQEDEEDSAFEKKLLEQIHRRAIFLLAAHGEKKLKSSKDIAEYALLLNNNKCKPKILSKKDKEGYLFLWAEYEISPFMEILNNASK